MSLTKPAVFNRFTAFVTADSEHPTRFASDVREVVATYPRRVVPFAPPIGFASRQRATNTNAGTRGKSRIWLSTNEFNGKNRHDAIPLSSRRLLGLLIRRHSLP